MAALDALPLKSTQVDVRIAFGRRHAAAQTNQTGVAALRAAAESAARLARIAPEDPEAMPPLGPQQYPPAAPAWDEKTAALDAGARADVIASALAAADKAGVELALKKKPDMIILDLMMPDVDGFEVVSKLRDDPTTAQIPILIYTAKNITSEDRERLQGNIQTIIQKGDFGKDRFLEMINNLQTPQAA